MGILVWLDKVGNCKLFLIEVGFVKVLFLFYGYLLIFVSVGGVVL